MMWGNRQISELLRSTWWIIDAVPFPYYVLSPYFSLSKTDTLFLSLFKMRDKQDITNVIVFTETKEKWIHTKGVQEKTSIFPLPPAHQGQHVSLLYMK